MSAKQDASRSRREAITESEWKVMEVLWRDGPSRMAAIVAALDEETGWNRTTVLTLAARLEKKGYIGTERSSRAYTYIPLVGQKEARAAAARRLIDQAFGSDAYALARILVSERLLSDSEQKKLRARLDRERPGDKRVDGRSRKKKK